MRRRLLLVLGLILILSAVVLAAMRAFERTAVLERIFGWSALQSFASRTLDTLTTAPVLVALLAAGGTLIAVGLIRRR